MLQLILTMNGQKDSKSFLPDEFVKSFERVASLKNRNLAKEPLRKSKLESLDRILYHLRD
jgi:hypothetical protein